MNLFELNQQRIIEEESPLANRMRPRTLEEYVGQEHIIGPGRLLRRAIQADQLSSLIFYGPPGTGKTTLAMVIANTTRSRFVTMNAVMSGIKDLRAVVAEASEQQQMHGTRTTLFVDEVHRWNKAQQDALLPYVEKGIVILIGATTANPYFEVNKALVSRSRIFQLQPLSEQNLRDIARMTLRDAERGYGRLNVQVEDEALEHLVRVAGGDARTLLNALELAVETTPPDDDGVLRVTLDVAEESIQQRAVLYDKEGDYHFDTISAFIKSLRGSDPDAALYWMAKMVYAGESPRYIFRRMLIFASEDVGLADPQAIQVVVACANAFEQVGLPEGRFHLAQAALHLATAPKSNTTLAFFDALTNVERQADSGVPNHLRDANRDSEGFGHGEGYLYPHAYRDHWVAQQYLPSSLQGKVFYDPSDQGYEESIRLNVTRRREAQLAAMLEVEQGMANAEILTFSPQDSERDRWLQRTISNTGERLGELRDRILDAAQLVRHSRVLDIKAGSGLLTWEALRRVPEGGVYALAQSERDADALRQLAARLPEIERPTVVRTLDDDLEPDLRFDAIVGYNGLMDCADKVGMVSRLQQRLVPEGIVSLAERIPRHTQRIYRLVNLDELDADLAERVQKAEEAIYNDDSDPLVNWDAADLVALWEDAGFTVEWETGDEMSEVRVSEGLLVRWFAQGSDGRPSYAQRLATQLNEAEITQVHDLYRRQLQNQSVLWHSRTLYWRARRR